MKNKYLFLRHAETVNDPTLDPKEWGLVPDGLNQINAYIQAKIFDSVSLVVTSTQNKAYSTGVPIAKAVGLQILQMPEFDEVGRSAKFYTDEEFQLLKKRQFSELDTSVDGGESGRSALERFKSGIAKLEAEYANQTILVISHSSILTLYFSELTNNWAEAYEKWKQLPFCALGLVENGKVIRDLQI